MSTLFIQIFVVLTILMPCFTHAAVVPSHDIAIISPPAPAWVALWRQGRDEARLGHYQIATEIYDKLLEDHPEIEDIRWEYCKIAYQLGDLKTSSTLLSRLVETNAQSSHYQLFAGNIALELKNFPEAIRAFTIVYESSSSDDGLLALEGLVTALLQTSQQQKALPLIRQLVAHNMGGEPILLKSAQLSAAQGLLDESQDYYQRLLQKNVLLGHDALSASIIFEKEVKYSFFVSELMENYLLTFPGDISVQQKLVNTYSKSNNYGKAIPHLEVLAQSGLGQNWLLLATLYDEKLNRLDKALHCYEEYLQAHPENKAIKEKISTIQTTLATEFLVLAESGVAEQLWDDLDKVISSPMDIYLKMAEICISQGKNDTARELIEILSKVDSGNDAVNLQIANLYLQLDDDYVALKYFNKISVTSRTEDFYLRKRAIEQKYNLSLAEYQSSLQLLLADRPTQQMIAELISKSIQYGFSKDLDQIVAERSVKTYLADKLSLILTIVRFYAECGRYTQANNFLAIASEMAGQDKNGVASVLLAKADTLLSQGYPFEAKGLYRQIVQSSQLPLEAINQLVDISISTRQLHRARYWYEFLANRGIEENIQDEAFQTSLVIIHAKILIAEQHNDVAELLLNNRMTYLQQTPLTQKRSTIEDHLENELCQFWYEYGETEQCVALLKKNEKREKAQYTLSQAKASSSLKEKSKDMSAIRLLELAKLEYQYKMYKEAIGHLQTFLAKVPHSTLAEKYLADCYYHLRQYTKARTAFASLEKNFKQEPFYLLQIEDIETKRGNDSLVLDNLLAGQSVTEFKETNLKGNLSPQQLTKSLQLTRLLWRTGDKEASLDMYQELLRPLQATLAESEQKDQTDLFEYHSWYDVPGYFSEKETIIDQMMSPRYLVAYAGTKKAEQAAVIYPTYRWQNLIDKEYNARKAAYQKKLFLAEKNYRKLFNEETSSEGMMDLATIYKRLGYYGREAQVYESVQEAGMSTSLLEESIELNQQQRKPQLSFEGSFQNKDGRDGAIDISIYQYGTSVWITPAFNQEYFLKYLRTNYQDDAFDKESNFVGIGGKYEFNDDSSFTFELGGEDLSGYGDLKLSGLAKIDHRLSDQFRSYLEFNQHRIDDTIVAIDQQIFSQTVEGGLILETLVGLEVGGDYSYSFLTGGNEQQRAHGWLFYNIFGETTQLDFHYDYEYLTSDVPSEDVPYWSPQDYQNHTLSLYFQHRFSTILPEEELNSYYSLEYAVGFEDEQNISYTTKFDIFLEMNSNFLLKSSFLYSKSDDYDESAGLLNIVYRW